MDKAKEAAKKMKAIKSSKIMDTEWKHKDADQLLCDTLRELGYGEMVDVFNEMHKWYA